MTIHSVTLQEQLAAVDRIMIDERRAGTPRNDALRAVAADLRARLAGAPSVAATELQRRMNIVKQSNGPGGYSNGTMIALAQEFIGRWPTIKLALERFETEVSK